MLLGYNTNGLAHHDPLDAIELLSEIGYRSVAITLDHGRLNPFAEEFRGELAKVRALLARRGMQSVIETGARFLLDRDVKHEPTLVSPDPAARARRLDFLRRAVLAARTLESRCVSIWSGILHDGASDEVAFDRLLSGLAELLDFADEQGVTIGFEPEPGMFIDTQARWVELLTRLDHPRLALTLDIGHLHCQREWPLDEQIRRWGERLVNVHIEDMLAGVHDHLMFGAGEIDFPPVIKALAATGYTGGIHVELSRHSHDGPRAARQAFEFLNPLVSGVVKRAD
jgi:L-ribulose-5-phosphate 3-epimerase